MDKTLTILKLFLGGGLAFLVIDLFVYKTPNIWTLLMVLVVLVLLFSGIKDTIDNGKIK
jgi:hypothetical protein